MASVIASYDGTHNERDAIALASVLTNADEHLALAYVRHSAETSRAAEIEETARAEILLMDAAWSLGSEHIDTYVVQNPSTPRGLAELAQKIEANIIVFCSDSHTTRGRVGVGTSASRLLDGGSVAIAIAPTGYAGAHNTSVERVALIDGDATALLAAQFISSALGAELIAANEGSHGREDCDLLIVGSRPQARHGTILVGGSSWDAIEEARTPVLVMPSGFVPFWRRDLDEAPIAPAPTSPAVPV